MKLPKQEPNRPGRAVMRELESKVREAQQIADLILPPGDRERANRLLGDLQVVIRGDGGTIEPRGNVGHGGADDGDIIQAFLTARPEHEPHQWHAEDEFPDGCLDEDGLRGFIRWVAHTEWMDRDQARLLWAEMRRRFSDGSPSEPPV